MLRVWSSTEWNRHQLFHHRTGGSCFISLCPHHLQNDRTVCTSWSCYEAKRVHVYNTLKPACDTQWGLCLHYSIIQCVPDGVGYVIIYIGTYVVLCITHIACTCLSTHTSFHMVCAVHSFGLTSGSTYSVFALCQALRAQYLRTHLILITTLQKTEPGMTPELTILCIIYERCA